MQLFCASNLSDLFVISAGMHMSRDLVSPCEGFFSLIILEVKIVNIINTVSQTLLSFCKLCFSKYRDF